MAAVRVAAVRVAVATVVAATVVAATVAATTTGVMMMVAAATVAVEKGVCKRLRLGSSRSVRPHDILWGCG